MITRRCRKKTRKKKSKGAGTSHHGQKNRAVIGPQRDDVPVDRVHFDQTEKESGRRLTLLTPFSARGDLETMINLQMKSFETRKSSVIEILKGRAIRVYKRRERLKDLEPLRRLQ